MVYEVYYMRYELIKMDDLDVYRMSVSNVSSSLFYHESKWYSEMTSSLEKEMEGENTKALRWFTSNAARALKSGYDGFIVSLRPATYTRNPQGIGYRGVVSLINRMEEEGWIDLYLGFVSSWTEDGDSERAIPSFVKFKDKYLALWESVDVALLPSLPAGSLIEIRDRKTGEAKSLRGRKGLKPIMEAVEMLNNSLKGVVIEFMGERVAPVEYKRIYTENLKECGRFFVAGGGVQLIPEKYRSKYLTFDGEPVVELDYSSIHPNICYERVNMGGGFGCSLKEVLGEGFKPYDADTSMLEVDWDEVEAFKREHKIKEYNPLRNLCKQALLTSINAVDRISAVSAVSGEILKDRKKAGTKDEGKRKYVGLQKGAKVKDLCEAIREHNFIIEDMFFSDMGVHLMNVDSNITARVIETMVQHGESILCYHDSYICRESAEGMLYEAMKEAWKEEVGDNQFCFIEKK